MYTPAMPSSAVLQGPRGAVAPTSSSRRMSTRRRQRLRGRPRRDGARAGRPRRAEVRAPDRRTPRIGPCHRGPSRDFHPGGAVRITRRTTAVLAVGLAVALSLTACTKKNESFHLELLVGRRGEQRRRRQRRRRLGILRRRAGREVQGGLRAQAAGHSLLRGHERRRRGGGRGAGNIEWLYQGSTSADAAAQADIVSQLHPAEGRRAVHRTQRPRFDGAADQAGAGRRDQGRHLGHRRAQLGARGDGADGVLRRASAKPTPTR